MPYPGDGMSGFFGWSSRHIFDSQQAQDEVVGGSPARLGQVERTVLGGNGLQDTSLFASRRADTIYPAPYLVSGAGHRENGRMVWDGNEIQWPDGEVITSRLTRNGTEVPAHADGPMTVYDVPEEARYELSLAYDATVPDSVLRLPDKPGYRVDTTWGFDSQRPTANSAPDGYVCGGEAAGSGACAPSPLLLLDYDLPLDLSGKAPAPGPFTIGLSGYHLPGAATRR